MEGTSPAELPRQQQDDDDDRPALMDESRAEDAADGESLGAGGLAASMEDVSLASPLAAPMKTSQSNGHKSQPSITISEHPAEVKTAPTSTSTSSPQPSAGNATRSTSISSNASTATNSVSMRSAGAGSLSSTVFVSSALESIRQHKEVKRDRKLSLSIERALDDIKAPSTVNGSGATVTSQIADVNPAVIFEPFELACATQNTQVVTIALDALAKLIQFGFFADPEGLGAVHADKQPEKSLIERVTDAICNCFSGETTPDAIQLQVIKAMLTSVLNATTPLHQASLLKAVRTIYNIFLLSRSTSIQTVAQGNLTQMIHAVFARILPALDNSAKERHANGSSSALDTPSRSHRSPSVSSTLEKTAPGHADPAHVNGAAPSTPRDEVQDPHTVSEPNTTDQGVEHEDLEGLPPKAEEKITIESFERRKSFDGANEAQIGPVLSQSDLYIKDAFLVFRALCKLSMKPMGPDSDMKSHAMRSKLLSLELIAGIFNTHMAVLTDSRAVIYSTTTGEATPFVVTMKQYLPVCLSRNASSSILPVFELSCDIFAKVAVGLRRPFKSEIEVLLNSIYLPILEMKSSTVRQKILVLAVLLRICAEPQVLVDYYLNYDCDNASRENIYERMINLVSKIGSSRSHLSASQQQLGRDLIHLEMGSTASASLVGNSSVPPALTTAALAESRLPKEGAAAEMMLKRQALSCLMAILRSLDLWASRSGAPTSSARAPGEPGSGPYVQSQRASPGPGPERESQEDVATPSRASPFYHSNASSSLAVDRPSSPTTQDDPEEFERAKARKTTLQEGIRLFNFKPKRGIAHLVSHGFIQSRDPEDIAHFLLSTEGLAKAMIGEYLGEGEEENVAIMHSFVDLLDFSTAKFVDSLRMFLQSFRLPGEAQKIDRFMLKFAERYLASNPGAFANADTAYILSYSVIMLNTDAHNPQVKHRMSKEEFVKNNRGINDGTDLPSEFLEAIYDEIQVNEIRMKDEIEVPTAARPSGGTSGTGFTAGLGNALATVGRDLQAETYALQSQHMANQSESLLKTMLRSQRRNMNAAEQYHIAHHYEHVRPMFQVVWIPILAALSAPLQDSEDIATINLCLDGFRRCIHIVSYFELGLERDAFVTTLAKFTYLNNIGEMKTKHLEAIKALLGVAMKDGNYLKESWRPVLTCVSQLERFQLISSGHDARALPDIGMRRVENKRVPQSPSSATSQARPILHTRKSSRPNEEVVNESQGADFAIMADIIFSSSRTLSGSAIVDFVRALSAVSWEEIESSGQSDQPRLFSLQKLIEISYYNMERIRLEWSQMWAILGQHFNKICCSSNQNVSYFALDALKQMALRFLEKEELANFQFQKDFLKPFEFTMLHNPHAGAKDLTLRCMQQMVQTRVHNLRSGWRTLFGVFASASKMPHEPVVVYAFELLKGVFRHHLGAVIEHGGFADFTVCLTEFCKAHRFQKVSLQAIEMLRKAVPAMLAEPRCPLGPDEPPRDSVALPLQDDPMIRYWFPVLFAFYDIIMNGEDLEVRTRALDYLFECLKVNGKTFPADFWDTVCERVLFPIFSVLRSKSDVLRFTSQEDASVWLSTTMIQALRYLIDLYTHYFETMDRMLGGLLELLRACITLEDDTLARTGTTCLQQLLESNVRKMNNSQWERVVAIFVKLFEQTTAYALFDEKHRRERVANHPPHQASVESLASAPALAEAPRMPLETDGAVAADERQQEFKSIIVKCVLQLLLIDTITDLFKNPKVYESIPSEQLLSLVTVLEKSYRFAKKFNNDKELRVALWKIGFMKQMPNLLKQESSSAATYVNILLTMYSDPSPERQQQRGDIEAALLPLSLDILENYNALDPQTQVRNVAAWTPVVEEVTKGIAALQDDDFAKHMPSFYRLMTSLLSKDLSAPIRRSLQLVFFRVGKTAGLIDS